MKPTSLYDLPINVNASVVATKQAMAVAQDLMAGRKSVIDLALFCEQLKVRLRQHARWEWDHDAQEGVDWEELDKAIDEFCAEFMKAPT